MTTSKITKKLKYEDIRRALNNESMLYITKDDALNFIDAELALLAKKNTTKVHKPTAKDIENNGYKELILNYMQERKVPVTCSELREKIPELTALNPQKVVGVLGSLVRSNDIVKQTDKNIVYWAIVED